MSEHMKELLLAIIVGGIVALIPQCSEAQELHSVTRLEAMTGHCRYTWSGDGVWYSSNYPGEVDTIADCGQLSVSRLTGKWGNYDTGWRLAYVNLGTLRWTATYALRDDEQFTVIPDGTHCDYSTGHGCVGTGSHWQDVQGLSLGWIIETPGTFKVGLDLGAFLYYGEYQYTLQSYPVPNTFPTTTTPQFGGWQITPYVGVTVHWGYLMGQVRRYASVKAAQHGCGNCSGLTHGEAYAINFGIAVPF